MENNESAGTKPLNPTRSIGIVSTQRYHSEPGKTTIAPEVLLTIARLTTLDVEGVSRMSSVAGGVNRLFRRGAGEGVRIDIKEDVVTADLYVILNNDVNIRDVSRNIQRKVARAISEMVGMRVGRVNVHIEDIDYSSDARWTVKEKGHSSEA